MTSQQQMRFKQESRTTDDDDDGDSAPGTPTTYSSMRTQQQLASDCDIVCTAATHSLGGYHNCPGPGILSPTLPPLPWTFVPSVVCGLFELKRHGPPRVLFCPSLCGFISHWLCSVSGRQTKLVSFNEEPRIPGTRHKSNGDR